MEPAAVSNQIRFKMFGAVQGTYSLGAKICSTKRQNLQTFYLQEEMYAKNDALGLSKLKFLVKKCYSLPTFLV